jgi:integrase
VDAVRARKPKRLPTVRTKTAVLRVIHAMSGVPPLLAKLLYDSGVRALKGVRVRVKDVDCAQRVLLVGEGKGEKDRITMLPENIVAPLQEHLARMKQVHTTDLADGYGAVYLPYALERKYPHANREWGCRLAQCAKEAAGKRLGLAGAKIGNAHLQWAFSAAAALFLRDQPAAQTSLARLEKKHATGTALTGLAQQVARAVYYLLQPQGACEREPCFQR